MSKQKPLPDSEEKQQARENFFEKVKQALLNAYQPAETFTGKELTKTTREIHWQFQLLYPSNSYDEEDIALFLSAAGFKFYEMAPLKYEWLLLEKTPQ